LSFCQTVFDVLFRYCILIMLIAWRVFAWHHVAVLLSVDYSPGFSNTCPQKQDILYTSAELSRGLWSLGFLKICPIFLGSLKIIQILCLFNIQFDLLFLWHMEEWVGSSSDCVRDRCLVCMFIVWLFLCLFCRVCFSVKLVLN